MDDLLSSFMAMGTTDHQTLIEQFCTVVPCDAPAAEFFLEANNWDLAGAVGSYLDQGGSAGIFRTTQLPQCEFVCDVTIGEGEEIPPGAWFTKTWRIRNSGDVQWPHNSVLVPTQGERMQAPAMVSVASLPPGATVDVSVKLRAPRGVGNYACAWRLRDDSSYFSEEIWVIITVAEGGLLTAVQGLHGAKIEQGDGTSHDEQLAMAMAGYNSTEPSFLQDQNEVMQQQQQQQEVEMMEQNQQQPQGSNPNPFGLPAHLQQQQFQPMMAPPPEVNQSTGSFVIPSFGSLANHSFGSPGFDNRASDKDNLSHN